MRKRSSSPSCFTEPSMTLPVSSYERPAWAEARSDGCLASVAELKLVYTRAPASSTATESSATSRILRLREGSTAPHCGTGVSSGPAGVALPGPRRQDQHDPGVARRPHLAALV